MYDTHIKTLLESISEVRFHFGPRSGGTYGARSCSQEFIQILLDAGYTPGCKTYTVRVPKKIREENTKLQAAFLRGLFATDGCVRLAKINGSPTATYPRISLTSASKQLIIDAHKVLSRLTIRAVTSQKKAHYRIDINGEEQLRLFEQEIGILQPKHRERVRRYL
ncbi:MAG: LAGLIDADG family homing endonuclease [Candidatus Woesearchaeota archaeon]